MDGSIPAEPSASAILSGQIDVEIGGQTVTLAPTLFAMTRIARHFGGMQPALQRITAMDFDAYVAVVRYALGFKSDAEARGLEDRIYAAGLLRLMTPLTEYLMVLANGGRPLDEPAREGGDAPGKDDA